MNPRLSSLLDASRWIAALMVVIAHVRHLVLIDYTKLEHASIFIKGIYFVTGLGHEAVVVFFVISGFLVGGTTFERWKRHGMRLDEYACARVARIYTVFLPALAVALIIDLTGATWYDGAQLYSQPARYHTVSLSGVITEQLNLSTFVGNVAMLQGIAVTVFGSNGPLWSLAYEWWYYWIFVIAAAAILVPSPRRWLASFTTLALLAWWLPVNLLLMGGFWLLGMAVYFMVRADKRFLHPLLAALIFAATIAWSRLSHNVDNVDHPETVYVSFRRDLVVAVGFACVVWSAAGSNMPAQLGRFHRRLADFSYSTYLAHFPLMLFLVAFLNQRFGVQFCRQPDVRGMLYLGGLSAVLCAYAYGFSLLTERHTERIRAWLRVAAVRTRATAVAK